LTMANEGREKRILVYADWQGLANKPLIGTLTSSLLRGKEVFSFSYLPSWLRSRSMQLLDPDLQWYDGNQFLSDRKRNFGVFQDSSPDRWGRMLMKRRETVTARLEERKPTTLLESDFLLGVYDQSRMGALRFKLEDTGEFLSHDPGMIIPPLTRLRELEYASQQIENDSTGEHLDEMKWLSLLLAPGASLGGARPKATVTDTEGNYWIAKFPSIQDDHDIGGWEMLVHQLAGLCGLNVAPAFIQKFNSKQNTFLTSRFDRVNKVGRLQYCSAMTMLGYSDGADYQAGVSYLEIAAFIQRFGANINQNLIELWKRILFNVMVKNTDDHLRNHGFLLSRLGCELSPAFDMNPVPFGSGLTLNISEDDNSLSVDLVLSVAQHFRVSSSAALETLKSFKNVITQWHRIAEELKLSRSEQDYMAPAFEH